MPRLVCNEHCRYARHHVVDARARRLALHRCVDGLMAWRLATDPLQDKCRSRGGLIDGTVDEVCRIITDLRPGLLHHRGGLAAPEWQFHEFAGVTGLAGDWQIVIEPGTRIDDNDACATAVFRIFQEVLNNIARHAHAQCVGVDVRCNARGLRIVVSDDGAGAAGTAFAAPRAYGVRGMRERARYVGGDIEISSALGAGTRGVLSMPLTPAAL